MNSNLRVVSTDYAAYESCVLPSEQVAIVEAAHQKFLSAWARELSDDLDLPVAPGPIASEQGALSAFLAEAAEGGCLASLPLQPGPGNILLWLTPGLLFQVLGMFIGAPKDAKGPERTSLTEIERHVLRPFFEALSRHLRAAWAHYGADFGEMQVPVENGAEIGASDSGALLLQKSDLQFGEYTESLHLCVPGLLVRRAAARQSHPGGTLARDEVRAALGGAKVELEAVLAGSRLLMRDLLEIEPGHVLVLGQTAGAPLECRVNGLPKFTAELIESRERAGLLISGRTAGIE